MQKDKVTHSEDRLLMILCTCILLLLFGKLYLNLRPELRQATQNYREGKGINLQSGISADSLKRILAVGNYYSDLRDIDLLADSLSAKLSAKKSLENLGLLNKSAFSIQAPVPWKPSLGGKDFENRLLISRQRLGFDSVLYNRELSAPRSYPASVQAGNGNREISGLVTNQDQPMDEVLVQLRQHIPTLDDDAVVDPVAYARTDRAGRFTFKGLTKDSGYSVIPMKPGFEFGLRQGTVRLSEPVHYRFRARPHQVRLIGPVVFGQLKDDYIFTVRTPDEFLFSFRVIIGVFLLAFWLIHFIFRIIKFYPDPFLLPLLMLLTGMSILALFSIQDPLQDLLHAADALQGVLIGLVTFVLLSQLNTGKIYTRWWFDPLFNFRKKTGYNLKGWTWLALAILLALITLIAGSGPEGSGVKVNLQVAGISFQPSEITKYLLIIFFAGFFAANEEKLRNLSDPRWRFFISWGVMAGTGLMLALYLLMGDMGPALVVCLTFLVFYSIARSNLIVTISMGAVYGVLLWVLPDWPATITALVVTMGWLLWKGSYRSAKWYGWMAVLVEAPVILILVIAAFSFGDQLPAVGERLSNRKNMWLSKWNNDVYGGDHLAHSYWTLSSGGFSGQGLGKGFPNTMPAAHTDMILPGIGEEIGWLGLVAIFLVFGVLIHRILLHARRAGQPFGFYLCAGVAVATGIQFLLIACGSIGLLPLTGVAVPFLSYGKISMVLNLSAMGIVAGISARPGKEIQKEHIKKYYDPVLITGITGFLTGILILVITLGIIQLWKGKTYIVRAARVINRNGVPINSYNPRIEILTRMLGAGTIYDRHKLVLATSDMNKITASLDSLRSGGVKMSRLNELLHKKMRRYYPFEEQMFYWVGDMNTRLFWGQHNGYFAESSHLSELRGFDNKPEKVSYITTSFRPDRFTKPVQKNVILDVYDYSALAESLRSGIDTSNKDIQAIRNKNRDVRLTVDASLQTALQGMLDTSAFKNNRISIVVLDAASGDLLASATHPLPDLQNPEQLLLSDKERTMLPQPVTERDLGMTYPTAPGSAIKILTGLAAFNKIGNKAANVTYNDIVRTEIIRDGIKEQEPFNTSVDMRTAIVRSSNIYFIRLANDYELDNEMAELYLETGMNVKFRGGYSYSPAYTDELRSDVMKYWRKNVFSVKRSLYRRKNLYGRRKRYEGEFSKLAWGQGLLTSTPAAMARMAAVIANMGILQPSRYALEIGGKEQPLKPGIRLSKSAAYTSKLEEFMIEQSNPGGREKVPGIKVAGKTGTPQRTLKGEDIFDGWFVFFAPTPDKKSHTVVCVRIEQGALSSNAVLLSGQVAAILKARGYLGSF